MRRSQTSSTTAPAPAPACVNNNGDSSERIVIVQTTDSSATSVVPPARRMSPRQRPVAGRDCAAADGDGSTEHPSTATRIAQSRRPLKRAKTGPAAIVTRKAEKSEAVDSTASAPRVPTGHRHDALKHAQSLPALKKSSSIGLPPWESPGPPDYNLVPSISGDVKIVSWNVASYRAILGKGLRDYIAGEKPDIVCLGETKVDDEFIRSNGMLEGYCYWKLAAATEDGIRGQAGVAIFSKTEPLRWISGIGHKGHDGEGRCVTAEFDDFFVVNTYVPNAGMGLKRMDNRMDWDVKLSHFLRKLDSQKPVIWCGDLNVARDERDLTNPKTNLNTAGFTVKERESHAKLLEAVDLVDVYREHFNDETDCYTFWSYRHNSRAKNIGWRLDYFNISRRSLPAARATYRRPEIGGSDHCPIVLHWNPKVLL